jgi:NAD(P) transhydrogenase subunit alpha
MKTIGLIKEPAFETRVCLLPKEVKRLIKDFGINVLFEPGFGRQVNISDQEYSEAGATARPAHKIFSEANFITSLNSVYEGQEIGQECEFLGIYNFGYFPGRTEVYLKPGISVSSLDLLPRTTIAQKMDVLSSMASLNGYKAVLKAAELLSESIPMFTTAAGTLRPLKVLVLGAGVAGLQAIATARRLGAVVEAFDVRTSAGEAVKSLGAKFIEVYGSSESEAAGGYAIDQTAEYQRKQKALIEKHLRTASMVICTANIPGKQAPVLIERPAVDNMLPGAVIIDLAAEQGGNCELSSSGKLLQHQQVKILGDSCLSRQLPVSASALLSNNFYNFIHHMCTSKRTEDHLLKACSVIENGTIVHRSLQHH